MIGADHRDSGDFRCEGIITSIVSTAGDYPIVEVNVEAQRVVTRDGKGTVISTRTVRARPSRRMSENGDTDLHVGDFVVVLTPLEESPRILTIIHRSGRKR
jgi:hypothetical protein